MFALKRAFIPLSSAARSSSWALNSGLQGGGLNKSSSLATNHARLLLPSPYSSSSSLSRFSASPLFSQQQSSSSFLLRRSGGMSGVFSRSSTYGVNGSRMIFRAAEPKSSSASSASATEVPIEATATKATGSNTGARTTAERPYRMNTVPPFVPEKLGVYLALSKYRLGALVLSTTVWGWAMAPAVAGAGTLAATVIGTGMCIASANSANQIIEREYDALMARTFHRPLPEGLISLKGATAYSSAMGVGGVGLLAAAVNPTVAALGAANILIYAGMYTPLKRMSVWNTHWGGVVGAIPPLMGWAAATGGLSVTAYPLAALLFAWQIPHFHPLAFRVGQQYKDAGFKMMGWENPVLAASQSVWWAESMIYISAIAPAVGLTDWSFVVDGGVVSLAFAVVAHAWARNRTTANARYLFLSSLVFLPTYMGLMLYHKAERAPSQDSQDFEFHVSYKKTPSSPDKAPTMTPESVAEAEAKEPVVRAIKTEVTAAPVTPVVVDGVDDGAHLDPKPLIPPPRADLNKDIDAVVRQGAGPSGSLQPNTKTVTIVEPGRAS